MTHVWLDHRKTHTRLMSPLWVKPNVTHSTHLKILSGHRFSQWWAVRRHSKRKFQMFIIKRFNKRLLADSLLKQFNRRLLRVKSYKNSPTRYDSTHADERKSKKRAWLLQWNWLWHWKEKIKLSKEETKNRAGWAKESDLTQEKGGCEVRVRNRTLHPYKRKKSYILDSQNVPHDRNSISGLPPDTLRAKP